LGDHDLDGEEQVAGIEFNEHATPQHGGFATWRSRSAQRPNPLTQTSGPPEIRRATLSHAWLSFPLGAVINATSIDLVPGPAK
jgi:hypothetical protein